jgi:hypothetical protein
MQTHYLTKIAGGPWAPFFTRESAEDDIDLHGEGELYVAYPGGKRVKLDYTPIGA